MERRLGKTFTDRLRGTLSVVSNFPISYEYKPIGLQNPKDMKYEFENRIIN